MDMTDSNLYDLPSWSFVDPFDDQAFRLHAAAAASASADDERLLATMPVSPFGLPGWDQLESTLAHEMGGEPSHPAKSVVSNNYPDRSARFPDAKHAPTEAHAFVPMQISMPEAAEAFDLDDLLRSTSQLATERALYMTVASPTTTNMPMYSPLADACSPGSSHLSSSGSSASDAEVDADWERELAMPVAYHLPGEPSAFQPPPFYQQQQAYAESGLGLTPLEMPDGSTRFTANWLPVDPDGGFTIHATPSASFTGPCPLEYPEEAPEAFISVGG